MTTRYPTKPERIGFAGVGKGAKAAQCVSKIGTFHELAVDVCTTALPRKGPPRVITSSASVEALLVETLGMDELTRELVVVVYVDSKNVVLGITLAHIGTRNAAIVEPAMILGPGLMLQAAGLIFVHNHPSGNPQPSPEDRELTQKLAKGAKLVGLTFLDSIIIGNGGRYFSFLDSGLFMGPR